MPHLLALDFGGTKHTAGLLRLGEPEWLGLARQTSPPDADAQTDLAVVFALGRRLLAEHAVQPAAVGVSFGGPVDFEGGTVRLSHHVPGWEAFPLRQRISAEFGAPAIVDNDANCGALGEWVRGAGAGLPRTSTLLYVTVSTGIGGGWIVHDRVHRGAHSMAGEIGHTTVDPCGPVCVCGRRGCLEVLACGPAIARAAREHLAAKPGEAALLLDLAAGDRTRITAELVARAAGRGDALAERVLLHAARDLGTGLGNALSLMAPDLVTLGGGVTKSGPRWWAEVRRAARANTLPEIAVSILPAKLGDDAPLWGAALLAHDLLAWPVRAGSQPAQPL